MLKRCVDSCLLVILFSLPTFAQLSNRIAIIPKPTQVVEQEGVFRITDKTKVYSDSYFTEIARFFSEQAGLSTSIISSNKGVSTSGISFRHDNAKVIPDSAGYLLEITPQRIVITARTRTGALYGMQSLLQLRLLQPEIQQIPCGVITDNPRFGYRGMHMDVSRNFYPIGYVKKFIDLMALYKMNTFHWHLTDGAGWRLQIKKYPKLTQEAAWRYALAWKDWWKGDRKYAHEGDPDAYGGYYTQEQAKEIVAYAGKRGITVIPEIEMPGHSEEVLAVYPHLSCSGLPYKNSEFCLGNDSTFTFLEDVLKEVMAIFPSTYIHIGGDEADKKAWKQCPKCQLRIHQEHLKNEEELQSYAVRRMEQFLLANNRKLLGWDEILEGGLAPEATVMSWRGEKGGITAASQGHDVIMTPGGYCYFDSYQGDPTLEPEAIGGFLPLEKVYSYEPVPAELDAAHAKHILGAQANTWAEYIPTTYHHEYMTFPRMLALSEVVWSPAQSRNWEDFKARLQAHYLLLQRLDVNYHRPSFQLTIQSNINDVKKVTTISFNSEQYHPEIRYTLDGSIPTTASPKYHQPFDVPGSAKVTAAIFKEGELKGKAVTLAIDYHKAIGKTVTYNQPYSKSYPAQGITSLVNGYRGSLTYGDGQWQGFEGKDLDVTIDMGNSIPLTSLSVAFMQLTGPGVFMPAFVEVAVSDDGKIFKTVQRIENDIPLNNAVLTFKDFGFNLKTYKARYIKILAKNNQRGFLFADEIIVY
jgi:hexosaminidase